MALYDGATQLSASTSLPSVAATATIPADAVCGSVRTYTAVATDSLGQTGASRLGAGDRHPCPPDRRDGGNPPPPAPPTVAFDGCAENAVEGDEGLLRRQRSGRLRLGEAAARLAHRLHHHEGAVQLHRHADRR